MSVKKIIEGKAVPECVKTLIENWNESMGHYERLLALKKLLDLGFKESDIMYLFLKLKDVDVLHFIIYKEKLESMGKDDFNCMEIGKVLGFKCYRCKFP